MLKLLFRNTLPAIVVVLTFSALHLPAQDPSSAELSAIQQQSTSIARIFPSAEVENLLKKRNFQAKTISTLKKAVQSIENGWDRQLEELQRSSFKDEAKRQWLAKCRNECIKLEKDACAEVYESTRNDELKVLCAMMIQKNAACLQSPICVESLRIAPNRSDRIRSLVSDFDADMARATSKATSDQNQTPQARQQAFLREVRDLAEKMVGRIYGNLTPDQLDEIFFSFDPISSYDEFAAKLPSASVEAMDKERRSWSK